MGRFMNNTKNRVSMVPGVFVRTLFVFFLCFAFGYALSCSQSSQTSSQQSEASAEGGPAAPSEGGGPLPGSQIENPLCGNGIVDAPEECDDGNHINGDGCDNNCTVSRCGNGIVAGTEVCDDGNNINGDGCDSNCTIPGCGNGIVDAGEECDDGNQMSGDGCDNNCTVSRCGNGIIAGIEACDDGNNIDGDGCDSNCTIPGCRNGIVDGNEACDDGNQVNGDGCDNNCTVTACGNGIVAGTEQCDDSNIASLDGCNADCKIEKYPFVFISNQNVYYYIYFSYAEPAGEPVKLLTSSMRSFGSLGFKPSGDKMVYTSWEITMIDDGGMFLRPANHPYMEIADFDLQSASISNRTRAVTDFGQNLTDSYFPTAPPYYSGVQPRILSYSPDGTTLAYVADMTRVRDPAFPNWRAIVKDDNLYDTTRPSIIEESDKSSFTGDRLHDAFWSPVTNPSSFLYNKVFYSWKRLEPYYSLMWVDATTTNIECVLKTTFNDCITNGLDGRSPAINPQGTKMAYVNSLDRHIYVCDLEYGGKDADNHDIVACSISAKLTNDGYNEFPSWSPDGQRIIFSSNRDGNWNIYIMWWDGAAPTKLTQIPGDHTQPAFYP